MSVAWEFLDSQLVIGVHNEIHVWQSVLLAYSLEQLCDRLFPIMLFRHYFDINLVVQEQVLDQLIFVTVAFPK